MNNNDPGYFIFDMTCPPLFIRSSLSSYDKSSSYTENDRKKDELNLIKSTLQYGPYHNHAILSNGSTVGELSTYTLRIKNHDIFYNSSSNADYVEELSIKINEKEQERINHLIETLQRELETHFNINISSENLRLIRKRYITPELFIHKNYQKILVSNLKKFLGDINKRDKGYTSKIKRIFETLNIIYPTIKQKNIN